MTRRAVITGLGPLTAVGTGVEPFWQGLRAGRSGIARLAAFDTEAAGFNVHHAGEVRDFDPHAHFAPTRFRRLDRYAQFAVLSARLALEDAGLRYDPACPQTRVGVSFGTALGGVLSAEEQHEVYLKKGARAVSLSLALQVFGGSAHSNVAIEYGLRGVGTTNSNSCASGTVAVGEALRYVREGRADVVVAGGAEAPLAPLTFGAFAIIRAMSPWKGEPPGRACRPFDATRDGFVMGEGAASLVVEEYEHARARGARIYAEVLGFSHNNDAYHMAAPLPQATSAVDAMRAALADAGVEPGQLDWVKAHASGTPLGDAAESRAIREALGAHAGRVPVSGTKPYHAHPLGATGAIETVICALAIHRGWIPPTLHLERPDPECCDGLDVVTGAGREGPVRYVLGNSFGFGGINACLVLGPVTP